MRRSIAWIVCISIFLSIFAHQIPGALASEKSVHILHDGKQVSELTVKQNEKEELVAECLGFGESAYQWQLLIDNPKSIWVDIFDKTERACDISYALLKNLLDEANSAYIRCMVTSDADVLYSEAVCVTVTPAYQAEPKSAVSYASQASKKASALANRAAESEYVTITIKYLDWASRDGVESAIYSPYTATIEKDTSFSQNVVSPTFIGFAPYYDGDGNGAIDDDASTVSLNLENVTEDVEIKVYYKPIEVNFVVRYYFQNINDDLYTENVRLYHTGKAETGTIIEDSYLREHAGDTRGFEKMYHIPETVAADGSTVFECYYDRNYYLIQFELDGGYGVDPIYARYGTPFIVNEPVKHGYTFVGWDRLYDTDDDGIPDAGDGKADSLDTVIGTENVMYKALWKSVKTTYTVAYWSENDKGGREYLGAIRTPATSGDIVSGSNNLEEKYTEIYRFEEHTHSDKAGCYGNCPYPSSSHTHTAECLSCTKLAHTHTEKCNPNPRYYVFDRADENVTVEGDGSSTVNIYYKPKEYTLRFFYARSSGSGDTIQYEVVGGSTYAFGGLGAGNPADLSVGELLGRVPASNWGKVAALPTFYPNSNDTKVDVKNYTLGSYDSADSDYTYYYFEFKARYGDDISTKWPVGILAPVKIAEEHGSQPAGYQYQNAYFSAWNGEYKVKYTQEHSNKAEPPYYSDNQTIKGRYMLLDENLLYDSKFSDSDVVSFLGFWENGANIGWSVPKLFRYHLMLESPDGTITNKNYPDMKFEEFQVFRTFDNSDFANQTATSITGFKYLESTDETIDGGFYSEIGKETIKDAYEVYFWYERKDYTLTYFNYENVLNTVSVPYDTLFTTEKFYKEPERYPPSLEPNAYKFVGWYTSPMRIYPIEFDKAKMPGEDVVWYAKWVPIKHTVNFFNTYDDMLAYESGDSSVKPYKTFPDVDHRTIVGSVESPTRVGDGNVDLIFSGWFYMENGEKKAFSPLNMPISRDINIFADWSSSSPQPYRLQYVLLNNPSEKVAEDTTGFAYAGSTRTFTAKAGNPYHQLYEQYNSGYFSTVASHSITMQYEEDKDHPKENVGTFYYVKAQDIQYTVRYVNRETNTVMDEVTRTTNDAVVTERFRAYEEMVPDAFYKRLVLSVEYDEETGEYIGSKDNVITFYYTPNPHSAYYAVHFMLEKPDATEAEKAIYDIHGNGGYEETGTHIEGIGDIDSLVSVIPQEFAGFSLIPNQAISVSDGEESPSAYDDSKKQYTITVTKNGTELYIFYERLKYAYTVHYYRYNTTKELADDKQLTMPYGSSVTETALSIPGYTCVSEQMQTISIRNVPEQNVIIFYYAPIQYVAEYVAVPSDGGRLSNTIEVIAGDEELAGSIPTANPYYSFDGWYIDEACTESASAYGSIDEATNQFIPNKSMLSEHNRNIFYAKFTRKAGNLTITRQDAENDGQVFIYEVKNSVTEEIITVTVTGNGSVTIHNLPFGDYTVTQQNDWSWRYDDAATVVSHQGENGTTVQFSKSVIHDKWLNGNSALIHNQRGQSE